MCIRKVSSISICVYMNPGWKTPRKSQHIRLLPPKKKKNFQHEIELALVLPGLARPTAIFSPETPVREVLVHPPRRVPVEVAAQYYGKAREFVGLRGREIETTKAVFRCTDKIRCTRDGGGVWIVLLE